MNVDQELLKYKNEVQGLELKKSDLEKQIIIQDERIRSLKEQLLTEYGTDDEAELLKIKENLEKEILELKEKINVEDI
jgi:hypothetical protein